MAELRMAGRATGAGGFALRVVPGPPSEHHKTAMLEHGRWVAQAEGDGVTAGYHLSALYSPLG
ncbi:MAG: phage terminase large subunit family protein [Nitrospira sp.]|nr:phage terminase large subunit family protein [Nitrospira sp.]